MSRLRHYPPRIKPPLRGRLAAVASLQQKKRKHSIRKLRATSGSLNNENYHDTISDDVCIIDPLEPNPSSKPWSWFVVLMLLVILSLLINILF
ncbi:hypothetical protein Xen7305DRAFT_00025610 [Xenococcus sp. PCC 7305]|uniref:hypothetical protein n=1 Tax=Xenococcus sp. PCC 7305 TaxID=102125 RepID=UPI0002AC4713|nr:hypothetical protein [Xenococcus sp. PCC 7305]ELS02843.1 hypothetical protein Xen7305DRAFT_00025610 [Xenococcus sp. PCC 7305]